METLPSTRPAEVISIRPGVVEEVTVLPNGKERRLRRYSCMDCGQPDPGMFMVTDEVWTQAGFSIKDGGMICILCFAKRLKRPMTVEDLSESQCNDPLRFAYHYFERS